MTEQTESISLSQFSGASHHSYTQLRASQDDPTPRPTSILPPNPGESDQDPTGDTIDRSPFPSAWLHRSRYILLLVFAYTILALFSWTVTGYLSFRPVYAHSHEGLYKAATVIQAIVNTLTIPLTSAVCSSAAVIFIQRKQSNLSLRQTMVLADKGWTDLPTYWNLLSGLSSRSWQRYGSSFLFIGIFAILLGPVINGLQRLFVTDTSTKISANFGTVSHLFDMHDPWRKCAVSTPSGWTVLQTRSALGFLSTGQKPAQLWQRDNLTCGTESLSSHQPEYCNSGGPTLGNMLSLDDPFLAQLSRDYHTGIARSFTPRINSTAQFQDISSTDFPRNCDSIPGAFFAEYHDPISKDWGLKACMPDNISQSPWKPTRTRQDFEEELFLNITVANNGINTTFYKVTLRTTAGYFELPNFMNGGHTGQLRERDPFDDLGCGLFCSGSWAMDTANPDIIERNRGPLATIAIALFGEGSFIATRSANPSSFKMNETAPWPCIDLVPLGHFLSDVYEDAYKCVTPYDSSGTGLFGVLNEVRQYLLNFQMGRKNLQKAFEAAAFLANQAWMESLTPICNTLAVHHDNGLDTQVPVISMAGLVLISVLLGLHLLILIVLATWSAMSSRWTTSLDSFTMMRIGGTIADSIPLKVAQNRDTIEVLDKLPGWIGDEADDGESAGRVGLGAPKKIDEYRRYICYEGDHEPTNDRDSVVNIIRKQRAERRA